MQTWWLNMFQESTDFCSAFKRNLWKKSIYFKCNYKSLQTHHLVFKVVIRHKHTDISIENKYINETNDNKSNDPKDTKQSTQKHQDEHDISICKTFCKCVVKVSMIQTHFGPLKLLKCVFWIYESLKPESCLCSQSGWMIHRRFKRPSASLVVFVFFICEDDWRKNQQFVFISVHLVWRAGRAACE